MAAKTEAVFGQDVALSSVVIDAHEEAGTGSGDRAFRPDVEGLRGVAVLLVVLYHADLLRITGGYVGVDVFFVISGFVITGVLTREREANGRTSLRSFYARRARRILPAATFVIFGTVIAAYLVLGVVPGNDVADDGRWAAVFLANFHFQFTGINYLTASLPPSPLQNYWSLSVEEQFYLVFPTLFLLVAGKRWVVGARHRLAAACGVIIALSFGLSIVQTASAPNAAYFSPLTRAWELALGALISVSTPALRSVPLWVARAASWGGLGLIAVSAFGFGPSTPYPGAWVAVPVLGAGLIIAGGVEARETGAELVLGGPVLLWIGRRSYSWYLVHYPVLVIAVESSQRLRLSTRESIVLVVLSLALASVLYRVLENPVRHLQLPVRWTILGGLASIGTTVALMTALITVNTGSSTGLNSVQTASSMTEVARQVAAAPDIERLPSNVRPPLSEVPADWGGALEGPSCVAAIGATRENICVLGDRSATSLMVAAGDSHVLMWIPALADIATRVHMRLVVLSHWDCPAAFATIEIPAGYGSPSQPYLACAAWRSWAIKWVDEHRPSFLLVSNRDLYQTPSVGNRPPRFIGGSQWQSDILKFFEALDVPRMRKVFLGDIPVLRESAPVCLSDHPTDVQACSVPAAEAVGDASAAESASASLAGVDYVQTTPWFCSQVCTPVIGHYIVYYDTFHITATYARYLEDVLAQSIGLAAAAHGTSAGPA